MHEFGWQGHQSNPPKARLGPDYPGLIEFLLTLRPIPDALGEFIPSNKQAAQIRRCGFKARAGRRFLIPRLPDELVWFNELAQLSNQTDPFWYPAGWKPIRAAIRYIAPIDLLKSKKKTGSLDFFRTRPTTGAHGATGGTTCHAKSLPGSSIACSPGSPNSTASPRTMRVGSIPTAAPN